MAGAGEGAAFGEDIDVGVDSDVLGLRKLLVLLEIAFVGGADLAAVFGGEVLVEDVGIVEVPHAAAGCDEEEERGGRDEARGALDCEEETRAPGVVSAAAGERDG